MNIGNEVVLPIGIEVENKRFKRVYVDEMRGYDEENLASPEVKGNDAKANTILIRRIMQEVPGLLSRKQNTYALIDENLVRNMYQADRDAIVVGMLRYAEDPTITEKLVCPDCGTVQPPLQVDLRKLSFTELPSDSDPGFKFVLPRGIPEGDAIYKEGFFRFPRGADMEEVAAAASSNIAEAQTRLMFRCVKMDDEAFILDRESLRRMAKSDRDYLTWMFVNKMPGYNTKLSVVCFNCNTTVRGHVNIASFFDTARKFSELSV
jgi:hypothetical protein